MIFLRSSGVLSRHLARAARLAEAALASADIDNARANPPIAAIKLRRIFVRASTIKYPLYAGQKEAYLRGFMQVRPVERLLPGSPRLPSS